MTSFTSNVSALGDTVREPSFFDKCMEDIQNAATTSVDMSDLDAEFAEMKQRSLDLLDLIDEFSSNLYVQADETEKKLNAVAAKNGEMKSEMDDLAREKRALQANLEREQSKIRQAEEMLSLEEELSKSLASYVVPTRTAANVLDQL